MKTLLVSTLLLAAFAASSFAAVAPAIRHGIVTNPTGRNVNVRQGPPVVTPLSYELADLICSIGIGSEFKVLDELHFLNGEIWYKIAAEAGSLKNPRGCEKEIEAGSLAGWMVGKVPRGWAVAIQDEPFTKAAAPVLPQARPDEPAERDSMAEDDKPLVDYLLLLLGTGFAVCVISIQRERSLKFADWFSPQVVFEGVLLGIANLLFVLLLMDRYIETSRESLVAQSLAVFTTNSVGFIFLGFILAILLLRFMQFSRS